MGRIASEVVSFVDFEELDVDKIIVVVVVFMLDIVGALVVSLLVMFEAPPWENKSEA